jgi:hypothetical protein
MACAGDGQVEQVVMVMAPIMGRYDVGLDVVVLVLVMVLGGRKHRAKLAFVR